MKTTPLIQINILQKHHEKFLTEQICMRNENDWKHTILIFQGVSNI